MAQKVYNPVFLKVKFFFFFSERKVFVIAGLLRAFNECCSL